MPETTPESLRAMLFGVVERQSSERHQALLAAAKKAPVPWDAELIKGISLQVSPKDSAIYSVHPGFDLQERLETVATTREIFYRAVDDLLRTRDELAEAAETELHGKAEATRFDHIEARVQNRIFSAASAAFSLVEHSRQLNKDFSVPGYEKRIAVFRESPQHNFIKGLRNGFQHSGLVRAIWQVTTYRESPASYTIIINKHETARAEWNTAAKRYIDAQGSKVDVLALFGNYRKGVDELHTWWQAAIEAQADPSLTDFRRVKGMITRVRMTQALRLRLPNLMAQDVDPYAHWQNYLAPEELEELETMPRRSAQQVGRFVDIVDADLGLCDDQMREMIYCLFKVQA